MKKYYPVLFLTLLYPLSGGAEENKHHDIDNHKSSIVSLSLELRNLLSQEMFQLQKGMNEIHPLYISGKWSEIVPIAKKIEESYVLKQRLTTEQVHELHTKLPEEFIELDQKFHYLSGMLGHAADMKKPELVGFYFSKMSETCLNCHTKFATHKFPNLAQKTKSHAH